MVAVKTAVFPGKEWAVEPAEAHGLDPEKLARAARGVQGVEERFGFLVVKDGVIVYETYFSGAADAQHRTFSVTKGYGSSLVGIAQSKGLLNVKDKVTDWLPYHHPDIVEDATIEQILSMTAGHTPAGTVYQYTSGPILNTLPNILWLASGMPPYAFYEQELAQPLGLRLTWPHTAKGWLQIGNRGPMPVMTATHRDLARLGLLWLNRGEWDGRRLIAEAYIDAALRPPFPEANNAYGYLWWLNTAGGRWRSAASKVGEFQEGKRLPSAPDNVYNALGANGQLIFVVPDHNLVVVSMGHTPGSGEGSPTAKVWEAIASFLPDAAK
jgi:CubicO group peptidase (beta-lactamase class C family)